MDEVLAAVFVAGSCLIILAITIVVTFIWADHSDEMAESAKQRHTAKTGHQNYSFKALPVIPWLSAEVPSVQAVAAWVCDECKEVVHPPQRPKKGLMRP